MRGVTSDAGDRNFEFRISNFDLQSDAANLLS